jgi:adenylate cyclase
MCRGSDPMPSCPPNGDDAPRTERRLAAIAFVDIVGYSILMARDETRTHQRWIAILNNIIRPQATSHRGRVVKSTGDGVLAEFPSAFDAVKWALEVQQALQTESARDDLPSITLRISVHVGDVITTDFDVFGDAVNLAARLQEHAPVGGIVLSQAVHDLVRGSLGRETTDLGPLELKNFEKPVRAFAIDPSGQPAAAPNVRKKLPSIAVLPLDNIGGNPDDDYFCDGCVEDITLSLAGLRELMVISRGSTLAYRGRRPDPREVGRMFGVRYILSGSLRRSERLVRVSVELCDANTGATLWGEKSEIAPSELFDVQDRIVEKIVAGIAPNVRAAELRTAMRKKPENFSAYDCTLRALHIMHSLEKDTFMQARDYLQKAMTEDPEFAMPIAWAARWYGLWVGQSWSADPVADRAKALELAAKAIELDGQNALALATYGHLKSFLSHDYDSALVYFERALAVCPNHSLAWLLSSPTLSYIGRGEEAIKHAEQALRLSPLDRSLFYYYALLGLAYYANGNYVDAVKWASMGASESPRHTANLRYLAAALAALDRVEEAREAGRKFLQLDPAFRLGTFERTLQPFQVPALKDKYIEHLSKAGLPN